MNIVIIFCLIYMFALVAAFVFHMVKGSRKERLKRLKSFKRGKFALIYFAAIPLFFIAYRFNGQTIDGAVWLSIRSCIEIVVLKFDYATVAPLISVNLLFHIAIELLYSLIILNTLVLTASVCGQAFINYISLIYAEKICKKTVAVIGSDANTLDILSTVPKGSKKILICHKDSDMRDAAFAKKAAYRQLRNDEDFGELLKKLFGNFSKKKVSVILNLEDDSKSLLYIKQICHLIESEKLTDLPITEDKGLFVYVFGARSNEALFSHYVEASKGIIHFINRHKQISMNFIENYPLTQFMSEREIDYSTATIRDGIDLNVFMIGFGKLNESLFLDSVSNNQFLTLRDGKLVHKPVKYHIYDRYYPQGKFPADDNVLSGNLHHSYTRYQKFLEHYIGRENEFLELPAMPAQIEKHALEISHPTFYSSLQQELTNSNSYNYIIVSYGSDAENIELAEKLQQKLKEWDVCSPVKIFVKVRDEKLTKELNGDFDSVIIFGSNSNCVYNAETIMHEKTEHMARQRHLLYAAEYEVKKNGRAANTVINDDSIKKSARDKWYSYKQFQRESNIYACLSIRLKLQLCGYDYSVDGVDCSDEFIIRYEQRDKRTPSVYTLDSKPIWQYSNEEQFRKSLRWAFAVQEHCRWCANMIANGLIPCSKDELALNKDELLARRKHGNLTTMKGLVEFRKIVAAKKGENEEESDVIRYDYQLMDDIVWLLHKCGYKLQKKKEVKYEH